MLRIATKRLQQSAQAQKFSTLLRQSSIFNAPPLQQNDHQITVTGTISHTTPTHFMVEYGGKFEIFCEYKMANRRNTAHQDLYENKSDNGLDAESEKYRIMEFYKGRKVVCLLDKHEDVEEFIGEFFPPSKYWAKGSFVEFLDVFEKRMKLDKKVLLDDSADQTEVIEDKS